MSCKTKRTILGTLGSGVIRRREKDEPVYAGYYAALREGGWGLVLPEAVVVAVAFIGLVEGVVEGCDEQDDVGQPRGDLVQED